MGFSAVSDEEPATIDPDSPNTAHFRLGVDPDVTADVTAGSTRSGVSIYVPARRGAQGQSAATSIDLRADSLADLAADYATKRLGTTAATQQLTVNGVPALELGGSSVVMVDGTRAFVIEGATQSFIDGFVLLDHVVPSGALRFEAPSFSLDGRWTVDPDGSQVIIGDRHDPSYVTVAVAAGEAPFTVRMPDPDADDPVAVSGSSLDSLAWDAGLPRRSRRGSAQSPRSDGAGRSSLSMTLGSTSCSCTARTARMLAGGSRRSLPVSCSSTASRRDAVEAARRVPDGLELERRRRAPTVMPRDA